jgi:hypothetical protein
LWLWDEFEVRVGDWIPREIQNMTGNKMAPGQIGGKLRKSVIKLDHALERMERCFLEPLGTRFAADDN